MTDRAQFEAMLEALINEDQETAKEIFHNIVVGKSREIYEELLESDFPGEEEEEEDTDSEEDDSEDDSEDDAANPFGDDADEEEDDASENPFGDEEGEGDLEDRVLDLEDALEELKAEFEELLAGEENEPEHDDMFGGEEEPAFGDEEGDEDEFGAELGDDDQEVKEFHHYHHLEKEPQDEVDAFLEYVNKVALPKHGDNGVQTKSVIDNMKNDMGGKTIGRSSDESKGGTNGGLLNPATKPQTGGNVNVPGAKSATKLSSVSKGHGAEKKGTGEKSVNDKSLFRGK
jgi:hypothetical protein